MKNIINEENLTIGADPEMFISYMDDDKKLFCMPPIGLEDLGLKILRQEFRIDDPRVVKHSFYYEEHIKVMSDGAALELTVNPQRISNISRLFEEIQEGYSVANDLISPFGFDLEVIPTISFDTKRFNHDERYKIASQFGCDADSDAFNYKFKCSTFSVEDYIYRHGGGHIHLGISDKNILEEVHQYLPYAIRLLAMTGGSYFLINSPYPNLDKVRMSYYGKPGKFRKTSYGLEFRSPSNAWTTRKRIIEDSVEWILLGLNLLFHDNAPEILEKYSKIFINSFENQNFEVLEEIMNNIKKDAQW